MPDQIVRKKRKPPILAYERALRASEQKSFDILNSDATNNGVWKNELNTQMSITTLKGLMFGEDWPFICCDRIASKIASQPIMVMKKSLNARGQKVTEVVEDTAVQAMLEQPNDYQTYYQWMYSLVMDLMCTGNAVNWVAFTSRQIIHIPIENIQIDSETGVTGGIKCYRVVMGSSEDFPMVKPSVSIPPSQICHVRRPNPSSMIWGLSPFIAGRKSVLFNKHSTEYLNNYYVKGAQPSMILEMDAGANENNVLRLLRSFEAAHTGRSNQRRNMILPKGVTAKDASHKLADQQLKEYLELNRETIINLLQVPKHELSLADSGSLGSEEYKTALRNFWNGPIKGSMKMIAQSLTKTLKPLLPDDYFLEFDLSDVEILQDDKVSRADLATKMLSTHSVNEIRAELYEIDPILGGEKLQVPHGQQPIFPQQAPAPQLSTITPETKSVDSVDDIRKRNIEKLDVILKAHDGWWARREAILQESTDKHSAKLAEVVTNLFADRAVAAINLVQEMFKDSGKKSLTTKADTPSKAEFKRRLRKALSSFEAQYVEDYANALFTQMDMGYDASLILPFNLPNTDQIAALKAKNADGRRQILDDRGIKSFAYFGDSTEDIMKIITDGIENNKTVNEMVKDLKKEFTDPDKVAYRLERIVRTETLTATSLGHAAAMADASSVIPGMLKMWVNAGDDKVRGLKDTDSADHWDMQGKPIPVDEPFVDPRSGSKMMYPRDTNGQAGDVINCFVGETKIKGIGVEKLYRRLFTGQIATVKLESGESITGTLNHPILTSKGWVALGSLAKGEKIVKAGGFDISSVKEKYAKNIQSTFEESFEPDLVSRDFVRRSGAVVDFHGDGSAEDVDIIDIETCLENRIESVLGKKSENLSLADTNLAHSLGLSDSGELHSVSGVGSSHSGISSGDLLTPSVDVESRPFDSLSLTSSSLLESGLVQPSNNSDSGNSNCIANLLNGHLLVDVHFDNVVDIEVCDFSGHVYNLQSKDGYYIANNIVVHNCRCTMIYMPAEDVAALNLEEISAEVNV